MRELAILDALKRRLELSHVRQLDGAVEIEFDAFEPDSEASIQFFYDTDGTGFDGFPIEQTVRESDRTG